MKPQMVLLHPYEEELLKVFLRCENDEVAVFSERLPRKHERHR